MERVYFSPRCNKRHGLIKNTKKHFCTEPEPRNHDSIEFIQSIANNRVYFLFAINVDLSKIQVIDLYLNNLMEILQYNLANDIHSKEIFGLSQLVGKEGNFIKENLNDNALREVLMSKVFSYFRDIKTQEHRKVSFDMLIRNFMEFNIIKLITEKLESDDKEDAIYKVFKNNSQINSFMEYYIFDVHFHSPTNTIEIAIAIEFLLDKFPEFNEKQFNIIFKHLNKNKKYEKLNQYDMQRRIITRLSSLFLEYFSTLLNFGLFKNADFYSSRRDLHSFHKFYLMSKKNIAKNAKVIVDSVKFKSIFSGTEFGAAAVALSIAEIYQSEEATRTTAEKLIKCILDVREKVLKSGIGQQKINDDRYHEIKLANAKLRDNYFELTAKKKALNEKKESNKDKAKPKKKSKTKPEEQNNKQLKVVQPQLLFIEKPLNIIQSPENLIETPERVTNTGVVQNGIIVEEFLEEPHKGGDDTKE